MGILKNIVRSVVNKAGFEIINRNSHVRSRSKYNEIYNERNNLLDLLERFKYIMNKVEATTTEKLHLVNFLKYSCACSLSIKSKSQLFQDLFVIYILNGKRNGFFVEFGATDGISLSNTYLLEQEYGWRGILCEPGKLWKDSLSVNRKCVIDYRCVWSDTGELLIFNETKLPELSTIEEFTESDYNAKQRDAVFKYEVETVSLNDLLAFHNSPNHVDYLSIDTEGSEYEILRKFDFEKTDISVITVEHNFGPTRQMIFNLLSGKGYKRVFTEISLFDDWYIKDDVCNN